jgi:hypothetical protein
MNPNGVIGIFFDFPSGCTGSAVDSPCDRNEHQEYFLGVKAAGA